MSAYYNEIDPFAAAWLRELIIAGVIAPGYVDERDIRDVKPDDLKGFVQCHFFAGIGVWSYALRKAGWQDNQPVWTGSCPCQPFSEAGKRAGVADERHLWPHWHHLIRECKPSVVFGEQVASKDGLAWLDLVCSDMEGEGYAIGAADLCAAGIGEPHIRQRLWFVADRVANTAGYRRERQGTSWEAQERREQEPGIIRELPDGLEGCRVTRGLANPDNKGLERRAGTEERAPQLSSGKGSVVGGLADTEIAGSPRRGRGEPFAEPSALTGSDSLPATGSDKGFWGGADWLFCADGKWRPVEPGTFPLAHGAPARVGRLRGYGNAINAEAAETFIETYCEVRRQ